MIPINAVLGLGLVLFFLGLFGVLFRKNLVIMLMSLELLLNGVNVILAGLGRHLHSPKGSIFALFIIIMAVSEAAVDRGQQKRRPSFFALRSASVSSTLP